VSLCTTAQVKAQLGIPDADAEHDAVIGRMVAGVSAAMAGRQGSCRPVEEAARVQYYDVPTSRERSLYLRVWPIVSIGEILEATLGDYSGGTALTVDEDYWAIAERGELLRVGYWLRGRRTVRATYTAGWVPVNLSEADGFSLGSGQVLMPGDIVAVAIVQCVHEFQRRAVPGVSGEGVAGGNVSYAKTVPKLLDGVKETMANYKRVV